MNKNILQRIASLQLQGKNGHNQEYLDILANDTKTLKEWSLPLTNQERAERNNAIFDHWLAGETETELAEKAKLNVSQVCRILDILQTVRRDALQITEQPPIYNVWNFASCDLLVATLRKYRRLIC